MYRKIIVILSIFILSYNLKCQIDTTNYQTFCATGSYGIFFISNDKLKELYNSNSTFIYSIGFRFGDSDNKLFPFLEYSTFNFRDSVEENSGEAVNTFRQNYVKFGLIDYIPIKKNTYGRVKTGISLVKTNENFLNIDDIGVGLYIGLGIERQLSREFSYFFDVGYDFRKIPTKGIIGDYGGFRIEMGLYLNLIKGNN